MIILLDELSQKDSISINSDILYDDKIDKRIKGLENAHVNGVVSVNLSGEVILDCIFKGKMIIEDSINLELVSYDFEVKINENLEEIKENYIEAYDFLKNSLDLKTILWQNIVLEVPISYTKVNDAKLKGNGWELINENEKVDDVDPRLKKLEELLEKGDD